MSLSRRRFLSLTSSAAASGLGLAAFPGALAARKLDILVLGGTKFLGPATVDAALARGHKLTLFNRGKTNPHLYPNVEKLRGDRDPLKDEGLAALKDRRWDAVIDDCGYYPRMVRASAELLSASGQYVFISSISAYKDNTRENADETAAVATMEDPKLETMGPNFEYYGALKALCEQTTREVFKDRATIVRPGYIVGPLDPTDRFTYWVVRADRGGEMLAPGSPSDPVQVIDVRDLGEWIVHTVEKRAVGTFNACGPERRLGMGRMLDSALDATGRKARLVWVPAAFLREHGENG
ncbi:MAG: NAD-dependent epimerase/dehydratase family protein, partial [Acidobacteria bacterium]|nr:NAD-dependent epimerase/dehydratase family protein [Acidobacteriota bacterium]